jgi:hypothetical protein
MMTKVFVIVKRKLSSTIHGAERDVARSLLSGKKPGDAHHVDGNVGDDPVMEPGDGPGGKDRTFTLTSTTLFLENR